MSKVLTVRGLQIGAGAPKIIVPVLGETMAEISKALHAMAKLPVDIVEWRADFFGAIDEPAEVLATLGAMRAILGERLLLFCFRSKKEGGVRELAPAAYSALNKMVAESGFADLVDVELLGDEALARENIAAIHAAGALVVGSNHDFFATPPQAELVARLRKMQELGADIIKIAVMPHHTADLLTLLAAAAEMAEKYAKCPLIAISMSEQGVLSRLAGELFGSAATFGAVGRGSAPGQIPVEKLAQALKILHQLL